MPRAARQVIDGGYYHIITRGNDRKRIFRGKQDYSKFLKVIKKYLSQYPVSVYHYCFMNNHIHFLIQTTEARHMPKLFQAIFQSYSAYFRKKYHHTGYLFQNRYKSYLIDKDSYLLECARYIERNPLRAKITESLDLYVWSSYLYYTQGYKDDIINTPNPLYAQLAESDMERRQLYKDYILQERPYDFIVDKGLMI